MADIIAAFMAALFAAFVAAKLALLRVLLCARRDAACVRDVERPSVSGLENMHPMAKNMQDEDEDKLSRERRRS